MEYSGDSFNTSVCDIGGWFLSKEKIGIIKKNRKMFLPVQTVDKAPLLRDFAIVRTAFLV